MWLGAVILREVRHRDVAGQHHASLAEGVEQGGVWSGGGPQSKSRECIEHITYGGDLKLLK